MLMKLLISIFIFSDLANAGVSVVSNGRTAANSLDKNFGKDQFVRDGSIRQLQVDPNWTLPDSIQKGAGTIKIPTSTQRSLERIKANIRKQQSIVYQLDIDEAKNEVKFQEATVAADGKWDIRTFQGMATNLTPDVKEALQNSAESKQWQKIQQLKMMEQ